MTKTLKQRLFEFVAFCEGGAGYLNLSWNFDGQGVSLGMPQFAWGQGKAQEFLKACAKKDRALFRKLCTTFVKYYGKDMDLSDSLLEACMLSTRSPKPNTPSPAMKWITERQEQNRKGDWVPLPHWQTIFMRILKEPVFQAVQLACMEPYWQDAVDDWKFYGGTTELELLFCLDCSIQNGQGKIGKVSQGKVVIEFDKRGGMRLPPSKRFPALLESVVATCLTKWQSNVRRRKECALTGKGMVNGRRLDLARDFGIKAVAPIF